MTPQAKAAAEKPSARAGDAITPPAEQSVDYEEALLLGVWPMAGLAPMDDTDYTIEGVAE
jgi:hypothetical protein